jgi:cellulase/cellobiase CelA1
VIGKRARAELRVLALGLACVLGACKGEMSAPPGNNAARAGSAGSTGGSGAPYTAPSASCAGAQSRGDRVLRRLARFEYDNSVEDLLGLQANASEKLAADTVVNGFDDNAQALVVTPLVGDQLYTSAETLAGAAMPNIARLAPCAASSPNADCAQQVIRSFGRRVFRRPLTDAELARYADLYALGSDGAAFGDGMQLVLTALLQSPNFLYRSELGAKAADGSYRLQPYELASELAYTLTGSTPDDALLDAAEQNQLATPEQLEAQARRLIASQRGQQQLVRFVDEWLGLARLGSVPKDAPIFPEFNDQVRHAMASEVQHYVEQVAFHGEGTLGALLTAPLAFVDATLAGFYGVPMPATIDADGFGAVQAPDPQRHGVLALGAVLTTFARPDSSSPVLRGKLVREQVLCQPLEPPPPGIIVQPPPVDPKLSVRERYAAHAAKQPCLSCHTLIDPIGFGFEHYDGVGRYRERDGEHPVDATGKIVASLATDAEFDGVAQLSQVLAQSDEVKRCFALQWFRFAYGVAESDQLRCALAQMQDGFLRSGGKLDELLLSATRASIFQLRQAAPEDEGLPPPDAGVRPDAGSYAPDAGVAGGTTPQNSGLSVSVHTDSSWDAGHCDTVSVRNESSAPIDWSAQVMIDGKLTNNWNSSADAQSGLVTFKGADWNRTIKPGETAQFGYCVSKT